MYSLTGLISKRGGGLCCFVHKSLTYKLIKKLYISNENDEQFVLEIIFKKAKIIIISSHYRLVTLKYLKMI